MKILLIEPFFTGSHKKWAEDFKRFSRHEVEIVSLPGYHWKWRMHGAAVTLANILNSRLQLPTPDLILATDFLDLSLFLSLTRKWSAQISTAVYFHENQLTYPWSPTDADVKLKRDNHYAFINYTSALTANRVFFNSNYHYNSFLAELPSFLRAFPDYQNVETMEAISAKCTTLPLALDLKKLQDHKPDNVEKTKRAMVLWNHRWEYDKNPDAFFKALFEIHERGIDFNLCVLGESFAKYPPIFDEAKAVLADKIIHWGFAQSFEEYCQWLWKADVLPVTSVQDFFGGSVIEAMYCNTVPFLPKRLAYLEHIPSRFHSTFYYDDIDFVNKLQRRIMDVKYLRVMDTRQYASKYDWQSMIDMYDEYMIEVMT